MDVLPDSLLLNIFTNLTCDELAQISRVSRRWYRVAFDRRLWQHVSLNDFEVNMSDWSLRKTIKYKLSPHLHSICLSHFDISTRSLATLTKCCPHLASLSLEAVNIHEIYNTSYFVVQYFPKRLKKLNLLHSWAPRAVYKSLATCLAKNTLEAFAAGGDFFRKLDYTTSLVRFFLRQRVSLKMVNFTECDVIDDKLLIFIILCCRNLKAISVRGCRRIFGSFLRTMLALPSSAVQALDMQSLNIRDRMLVSLRWTGAIITELDLSWCRGVSEPGLLATVPNLKFLRCLELFLCGFGGALTDNVLARMAEKRMEHLEVLDISYSHAITNEKTREMLLNSPKLRCVRMHHCRNLLASLVFKNVPHLANVLIYATFPYDDHASPVPYVTVIDELQNTNQHRDTPFKNFNIRDCEYKHSNFFGKN